MMLGDDVFDVFLAAKKKMLPFAQLSPPSALATQIVGQTGPSIPGGPIAQQYMPSAGPITILPAKAPSINLNLGTLFAKQVATVNLPPAATATRPVATRILNFSGPSGIPQIGFEQREGLWVVSDAAAPLLRTALDAMTFSPSQPDGNAGQAVFVLGQTTGNAQLVVNQKIAAGFAALIDKTSVPTGMFKIAFTSDPSTVASMAGGPSAQWALISSTDPKAVLAAAAAATNPTTPGTVPASVVAPTPWVLYGLLGTGVVLLGYIAVKQSKKTATANRRRHRTARKSRQ
jgi:hypothetical protein